MAEFSRKKVVFVFVFVCAVAEVSFAQSGFRQVNMKFKFIHNFFLKYFI